MVVQVIGPSSNPPTFESESQTENVAEGSPFNTNITTIVADSPDELNLAQYSIVAGNDNNFFAVELLTGRIYVTGGIRDPGEVRKS